MNPLRHPPLLIPRSLEARRDVRCGLAVRRTDWIVVPAGHAGCMREELPEFADLLAGRTPAVVALARRLRGAALDGMPDLVERFYPGWQGLGWRHPDGGL